MTDPKTHTALSTVPVLAALFTGMAADAQGRPLRIVGQVVRDSGQTLVGAEVRYFPSPRSAFACLRDWPVAVASKSTPMSTLTKERGRFSLRFPPSNSGADDIHGHRGALVVLGTGAAAGLGAVVLQPGGFAKALCRSLAEVRFEDRCDVHIQAISATGEAFDLGHRQGVEFLRLPAGNYRLLAIRGHRVREQQVRLRPGVRLGPGKPEAPVDDPPRIVQLTKGVPATLHLRHWPRVPLPLSAAGEIELPAGNRPIVLSIRETHEGCTSLREIWIEGRPRTVVSAAPHRRGYVTLRTPAGKAAVGVELLVVRSKLEGGFDVDSLAVSDAQGRAEYAVRPSSSQAGSPYFGAHLLAIGGGFAPVAIDVPETRTGELEMKKGHGSTLSVLGPRGDPAGDVDVEFSWPGEPLLRRTYSTDATGRLSRADLPEGVALVRLRDDRYLHEAHSITVGGDRRVRRIRAMPGFTLRGFVVLPNGSRAKGAIVTATDPTGQIQPASRTAITGADGSFAITGLPEHLFLRLSARLSATRAGGVSPYISQRLRCRAGNELVRVQLKSEDPTFPGTRRGTVFVEERSTRRRKS